jgi:hypothetical protein
MIQMTPVKTKAISISAVLDDKKLSKLVADALNSAPGSSKRERAKAIITSLTRNRNDGMGGPGVGVSGILSTPTINYSSSPVTYPATSPAVQTGVSQVQPASGIQSSATTGIQGSTPNIQGSNQWIQGGEIPNANTYIFPAAPTIKAQDTTISTGAVAGPSMTPETYETPDTGAFTDDWYNSLSDADQASWKPLYDALKAGVGPNTFALQMLSDQSKLRTLPGMADIPADALPTGASLAGALNDLDIALREELNLNNFSDNLKILNERGMDLTDNLTAYITNRDKYISHLDKMIGTAEDKTLNMSSNPWAQKQMSNYTNYLYTLKGRQQKRYIDALNMGINYHNKELTRAETAYNDAYKIYADLFKTKAAITTETYNNLTTMLTEMYNNIAGREMETYNLGIKRAEYLKAQAEVGEGALGALGDTGKMTEAQIISSQANYFNAKPGTIMMDWWALPLEDKIKYTKVPTEAETASIKDPFLTASAAIREIGKEVLNRAQKGDSRKSIETYLLEEGFIPTNEPWKTILDNYAKEIPQVKDNNFGWDLMKNLPMSIVQSPLDAIKYMAGTNQQPWYK